MRRMMPTMRRRRKRWRCWRLRRRWSRDGCHRPGVGGAAGRPAVGSNARPQSRRRSQPSRGRCCTHSAGRSALERWHPAHDLEELLVVVRGLAGGDNRLPTLGEPLPLAGLLLRRLRPQHLLLAHPDLGPHEFPLHFLEAFDSRAAARPVEVVLRAIHHQRVRLRLPAPAQKTRHIRSSAVVNKVGAAREGAQCVAHAPMASGRMLSS